MPFDFHVHLGLPEQRKIIDDELGDLHLAYNDFIKMMDSTGVNKAVVMPIPHRHYDIRESNNYILEAATKYSERLIPFCRIDENLENNLNKGFKGVKLHMGRARMASESYEGIRIEDALPYFNMLEVRGIPFMIHASFKDTINQIETIMDAAPRLKLVLAHCGRGAIFSTDRILENAQALKKYDTVYFETSTTENPLTGTGSFLIKLANIIGSSRILFGTDYPFFRNHFNYSDHVEYIRKIHMDDTLKEKISMDNAMDLLDIKNKSIHISIRPTNIDDIPKIFEEFFNSLSEKDKKYLALGSKLKYRKDWERCITKGRFCFVAELNNKIVGYMRCYGQLKNPESGDLWDFVVHPEYRGMGIATQMLTFLHHNFSKMFAKTDAKNIPMISLLKKFGYIPENEAAPRIIKWHKE